MLANKLHPNTPAENWGAAPPPGTTSRPHVGHARSSSNAIRHVPLCRVSYLSLSQHCLQVATLVQGKSRWCCLSVYAAPMRLSDVMLFCPCCPYNLICGSMPLLQPISQALSVQPAQEAPVPPVHTVLLTTAKQVSKGGRGHGHPSVCEPTLMHVRRDLCIQCVRHECDMC